MRKEVDVDATAFLECEVLLRWGRESMTKAEFIEKITKSRNLPPDVSKKLVQQILDLAFDELGSYFARARVTKNQTPRFTYPGFGTFTKKQRQARKGVNPRTLEPMRIDASFTVDFRPGVELRRVLNSTGAKTKAKNPVASATEDESPLRRLRTRDEIELDSYDAEYDPSLFGAQLPESPMQRVRGRRSKAKDVG